MTRPVRARLVAIVAVLAATLSTVALTTPSASADDPGTAVLSAHSSTVLVGDPLTFDYAAPANQLFATNWIGLFSGGSCVTPSAEWAYSANGTHATPSAAVASGSVTFDTTGWAAGTYTVCFLANDGYDLIAGPITVQVVGSGISAPETTVPTGTPVTVTYSAPDDQMSLTNWVGWYRGATTCGSGSTYWQYTQTGTQTPPPTGTTPVASGTLTFSGMTAGSYAVCLLYNDGYTIIGSPLIINVVDATQSVTVTSGGHGTASASPVTATPGTTVTLSETPDPGYHFASWQVTDPSDGSLTIGDDNTFTMPSSDVAIEALFDPDTATIHFDGNGADNGSMADQSVQYDAATPLDANGYSLTGADFAGWATSPHGPVAYADAADFTDQTPVDDASITLYARWRGQGEHLVSVDDAAHGTATPSVDSAAPGDPVQLTATPSTGYHFTGWDVVSPSGLTVADDGSFTMPSSDVEVAPRFAAITYRVVYRGNGADAGAMSASTFTYDQAAPLAPDAFARNGYSFAGWGTSAGGPVVYADQQSVENLTAQDGGVVTLYARWTRLSVQPGSWGSLPSGFVTDTFKVPEVSAGAAVSQPVLGLWNGAAPATFTKVSGSAWLHVTPQGTVTGTAPHRKQRNASITVQAEVYGAVSQLLVEVPVESPKARPAFKVATWNAWQAGSNLTDAVGKNLAVLAARGIDVVGFQDGGYRMAQAVGAALGWSVRGVGDLGIVSRYPVVGGRHARVVYPTTKAPAAAVTISVAGKRVRVWDVHLDEAAYGPYNACFHGVGPKRLVSKEKATKRFAQARHVRMAMARDLRRRMPVIILGDLASPAASDWTAKTRAAHCHAGAVQWPVPRVFTRAGLVDSYRTASPHPLSRPGITWSPMVKTNANGKPEPQDRIDYVDYSASGLGLLSSDTVWVGRPSASDPGGNSWASDHAAVVSSFSVGRADHRH